jgi:hypothetical protein
VSLFPAVYRYFFFQVAPHEAEWTQFQTHYFSENLVANPDLWICSQEL